MSAKDMSTFLKQFLVQENSPPFVTCEVAGGLGNQLFQIAAGFAAAHNSQIEFRPFSSSSAYTYGGKRPVYWKTVFSKFSLCEDSMAVVSAKAWKEPSFLFCALPCFAQTTRLVGYFQSYRYFDHVRSLILSKLTFPLEKDLQVFLAQTRTKRSCEAKTSPSPSITTAATTATLAATSATLAATSATAITPPCHPIVSLHVRSYVEPDGTPAPVSIHCRLSSDYYHKAADIISKTVGRVTFLVFADDAKYARSLLASLESVVHLVYLQDLENSESLDETGELKLMSMCDHHVLANSTFSWWAGYLRGDPRTIIAPQTWFGVDGPSTADLIPSSWTLC